MFNLFEGGIKDAYAKRQIPNIDWLIMHIKDNQKATEIEELQQLYLTNELDAKELKTTFPYITPHGTFKHKRSKMNIDQFSGYLYFDIDKSSFDCDVTCLKSQILAEYGEIISVLGLSISGLGVFFYVKIGNKEVLNKQNFDAVHHYFRTVVFKNLPIDSSALGIDRAQFLPYDPDVYINKQIEVNLSSENLKNASVLYDSSQKEKKLKKVKAKRKTQHINREEVYSDLEYELRFPKYFDDIKELFKTIRFKTYVEVNHPIVEIKPEYKLTYRPPFSIKKGKVYIEDSEKHKHFLAATNALMYINPGIQLNTILSYINYLNNHWTRVPMQYDRMEDIVTFAYTNAKETGELLVTPKLSYIHFNENCGLSGDQKRVIANKLNGLFVKRLKLELIEAAMIGFKENDMKLTMKNMISIMGYVDKRSNKKYMSAPTV